MQSQDTGGRFGTGDSVRARSSTHGNYVVFESASLAAVRRSGAAAPQAFLAYLGPK